jgi:hypothetical protein
LPQRQHLLKTIFNADLSAPGVHVKRHAATGGWPPPTTRHLVRFVASIGLGARSLCGSGTTA